METAVKEEHKFRRLCELSLIDNFLFGLFIQEAEPEEIKKMLECMLGMKITEVEVFNRQQSILQDPGTRNVILDAYVRDVSGNIYNIEVQASRIKNIPKRMRYYQSMIDRDVMPAGKYDYDRLPRTIIIFVTDYDVFGKGLYRYTFKNTCQEDSGVEFGDETLKIVLNTKGTCEKGVSAELAELLRYFRDSTDKTADSSESEFVKSLNKKLTPIKNNTKFGDDLMSLEEMIYCEKKEGIIVGTVRTFFKVGRSAEEIIAEIMEQFSLSREEAEEYVKSYAFPNDV